MDCSTEGLLVGSSPTTGFWSMICGVLVESPESHQNADSDYHGPVPTDVITKHRPYPNAKLFMCGGGWGRCGTLDNAARSQGLA
jgi:hypothetical protein